MSKYAAVVVGYNRTECIKRLLDSLLKADYQGEEFDLIVSLDHADSLETKDYADSVKWPFGHKEVIYRPERMGLKAHILSCGDFLKDYEAIAVLEDDLIVSPGFYSYMKQTVDMYKDEPMIAGISLYSFKRNINAATYFEPDYSEYDVYMMQKAQSWGQIWIRDKWQEFLKWYDDGKADAVLPSLDMPQYIKNWNNSWLKYHTAYCVAAGKYFVYPYMSLTTCCAVKGEHTGSTSNIYQVPLFRGKAADLRLPSFEKAPVKYDIYYEREDLSQILGIPENKKLCVDLYNTKTVFEGYDFIITCRNIKGLVPLKSFGLELHPHEGNIIDCVPGKGIFLYKLPEDKSTLVFINDSWEDIEYHLGMPIDFGMAMLKKYIKKIYLKKIKKK